MIKGLIYSVISGIAFGMLVIFAKLGYSVGMDAKLMLQCRFTFALPIMLAYIFYKNPGLLKINKKTLVGCAITGLFIYPLQSFCFISSAQYIPASMSALILYIYPLTVTLLSAILFRMKIDRKIMLSLFLIMGGCVAVFYDAFLHDMNTKGLMLATAAMLTFSSYLIFMQKILKDEEPLRVTFYVILFSTIVWNVTGDVTAYATLDLPKLAVGFGLALIAMVISSIFLFLAIKEVGSAFASIFSSIEPVITLLAAGFILGEHVDMYQMIGCALIITGIVLPNAQLLRLKEKLSESRT